MNRKTKSILLTALLAALAVTLAAALIVVGAAAEPLEADYISITAVENSAIVDVVVPAGNLEAGEVSFLVYRNGDGDEDVEYVNQYATDGALAVTFPAQEPIVVYDELLVQIGGGGLGAPIYKVFYMTNKGALQAAVDAAEDAEYNWEDYTLESYAAFEEALGHAKEVLESDRYSQYDVDAVEEALAAAIEALEPKKLVGATVRASVLKVAGNKNELTITVTDLFCNGTEEVLEPMTFVIDNNAIGTYDVHGYRVYVDTKGNIQVREIYITNLDDVLAAENNYGGDK